MKKILLIPPQVLPIPAVKGGAIETLMDILIEENEKYHKAELIFFSIYDKTAVDISRNYKYTKIIYIRQSSWFIRKLYGLIVNKIFYNIFNMQIAPKRCQDYKLVRVMNKLKYDYIVSQSYFTDLFSFVNNKLQKKNMYFHSHSNQLPTYIEDDIYGKLIGISDYVNEEWNKKTTNKQLEVSVVHNCIREEIFSKSISLEEKNQIRKNLGFDKNDFIVLFCGRVIEVKGVRELLKALENTEYKNIKLLLIGSANFALENKSGYEKEVNTIVRTMDERVKAMGYVDNKQLYKYYQSADIQVVPSLWEEAAGLVAIEGMASGLPLIVTNSGGMIEYVDEKCSIIIEKNENIVENIKDAVEEMYCNPELRKQMSENGKKRAKCFTKKRFYDEVLGCVLN